MYSISRNHFSIIHFESKHEIARIIAIYEFETASFFRLPFFILHITRRTRITFVKFRSMIQTKCDNIKNPTYIYREAKIRWKRNIDPFINNVGWEREIVDRDESKTYKNAEKDFDGCSRSKSNTNMKKRWIVVLVPLVTLYYQSPCITFFLLSLSLFFWEKSTRATNRLWADLVHGWKNRVVPLKKEENRPSRKKELKY